MSRTSFLPGSTSQPHCTASRFRQGASGKPDAIPRAARLGRRKAKRSNRRRRLFAERLEDRRLLAGVVPDFTMLDFETELTSLELTGGPFPMPLASDPGNALFPDIGGGLASDGGLASIEGYGFVNSLVTVTLSSQRLVSPGPPSLGEACAFLGGPAASAAARGGQTECSYFEPAPINPEELDGEWFYVDSFFDVFFDITVTDVDSRPGRDFAGQPDGASIMLPDNGPAGLQSFYQAVFDKSAPNFGLIPPPEADPYIGHFDIEIPLGGDINGNGEDDKIKFTLATHSAGDQNRTFIQLPDGTILDTFDSAAFLEGAVVDLSTDPPFQIGQIDPNTGLPDPTVFGGPTTASSQLLNPVIEKDLFEHSLAQVMVQWADGTQEQVTLAGPTLVHVTFDGALVGSAVDDDGDGLDDLQAEMVALELSGSSSAGPILMRLDPTHRSMGELEERINNTPGMLDVAPFTASGEAASFFDVFVEVRLPDGTVLHGDQPVRMQTKIYHKPPAPGETYQYAFAYWNPIRLLDAQGNPTGISLLDEAHTPNPEIEVDFFPYSIGEITLRDLLGNTETVVLAGPSTVHVVIPPAGIAADTDGDGRDQVPTELVEMELRGTSTMFGPILVTLDPNRPSRGEIEEQVNSTPGVLDLDPFGAGGAADSFFDVFALIHAGGQVLHTAAPLHIEALITHKPPAPGESYANRVTAVVVDGPAQANAADPPPVPGACTVPDNGTGTIFLPPAGCEYLSPDEVHMIIDGLPPDSTIELAPIHKDFICRDPRGLGGECVVDDGDPTNGETEVFNSTLEFEMRGTGLLDRFQRTITIPNVSALVQSGPRQPGNLVQGFDTEMVQLLGELFGDPDFDTFRVKAGSGFGLPSPGHTTLTRLPSGNWNVDSFFDITYQIEFAGAPGGPFEGQSGTTTGTIRMQAAGAPQPDEGLELLDEFENPTGVFLTQEVHTPNPEIEIDVFPDSLGEITLQLPGPVTETVKLTGPTTVHVVIPPNGRAADTDGDGRDQVPTEMVQLELRGTSSLGPVLVRLDPNRPTRGEIEEQTNNTPGTLDIAPFTATGQADSFFDVFFEIEVGGQVLHNDLPMHLATVITHKPPAPGETYVNPFTQPVQLLDANGNPTGIFVLQERHTPNPERDIEIDQFAQTTALVQLAGGPLGPAPRSFILTGPAEAHVFFDGPNPGDAIDSDGDGLDDVATQLVSMNLTDGNVTLRVRDVAQSPYQLTRGQIEENQNNTPNRLDVSPFTATGSATSFFDVFFELDVAGVGVLHNEQPMRVQATIYEKPPYRRYIHLIPPDGNIELYDQNNQPTGVHILKAEHDTGKVEIDVFPESVGQIQIELPNPPIVVTPSPALPPLEAVYVTAGDVHATFRGPDLEIVLQDVRHRPLAVSPPQIANLGKDEIERFQSSLRATAIVTSAGLGLDHAQIPVELLGPVTTRVAGKVGQTTGTFDTEMLSMNLAGKLGALQVMLRESPTRQSHGRTSITSLGGAGMGDNYRIDSFFDIWTEISLDGGRTWVPTDQPATVRAENSGIQTPDPKLPPNDGVYRSPAQVHAEFQGPDLQIVLQDVQHSRFQNVVREDLGDDEVEQFDSTVVGIATINGLGLENYLTEVTLSGPVVTIVHDGATRTTGTFDTEMISMSLSGTVQLPGGGSNGLGIMIRESPTRPSTGRTSVRALGNGTFHVDSFFDIWTELSLDGGQTWTPSTGSAAVELTNPPRLETVDLVGPATVAVFFEGPNEGDAKNETDPFGRDEVQTDIVELDLRGTSELGPVVVTGRPGYRSPGQITEYQQFVPGRLDVPPFSPVGQAYSYFYVWPQIEVGGRSLVTTQPLLIDTFLQHKPPQDGERYESPQPVRVPLVDANGNLTGAYVVREIHQPAPTIEVDELAETTALVQLVGGPIGPAPTPFLLRGPAKVHVYFDGANEGDAADDDGDGLDEVVTQLVSMNLTDGNIKMRVRSLRESPTLPSLGRIEEQTNNTPGTLDLQPFTATGTADSFFDVFFEIELPDGSIVHNEQPVHIQAVIDHKPPIARYIHILPPSGPIELVDQDGVGTGVFLVNAEHYTGYLEVDHFEASAASVELIDPLGNSHLLRLSGPSTAHVFFEGAEGDADDDNSNGRDEVRTELVQLDLHGSSPLGPVTVRLDPRSPSAGQIEELVNNTPGRLDLDPFAPGDADSFFDVFFEIEVGGRLMYPATPKRMSTVIDHKPPGPGTVYENPEVIPLVDAAGNPTGYSIGRTRHIPVPKDFVEVDQMPDTTALVQLVGGPLGNLPVPLILHGSSEAHVFFEGSLEGDALDDNSNGRDEVDTQLVSMNLTDGNVTLRLNPSQASLGQIEELVNNNPGLLDLDPFAPGDATSFFDVFFEIELPGGQVVHNGTALRVQSVIKEKPPLARYIHLIPPTGPIELLDAANNPTGVFLVQAEHYTGHIERDVFEQTTALIQLAGVPGSSAVTSLILHGPAAADVYFESAEGQARDDDGDGRDEVYTELVSMNLTDGNVTLRLNPSQVSAGQIEERANNTPGTLDLAPFAATGTADSFFDVFFEIEAGGLFLYNLQPLRVQAVIDHKPPIARYIHILPTNGPIELVDAAGNPTGVFLVRAEHYTGHIEVDHFENSLAVIDLIDPQGNSQTVQLSGPSTAHVFFEGLEGQADDDNGNNRDEVATELVQLDLSGRSSLGPVSVRLNPRLPSTGQIEEQANNTPGTLDIAPFTATGLADSFFDVFFEIQVGNRVLYPAKAKHLVSVIDHKPPGQGAVYESPEVIPLLDRFGRPTGFAIGATRHIPVPRDFVEVDQMPDTTALVQLVGGPLGNLPVPLILHGSSETHVFFEGPLEGDAWDDNSNGRDEVDTQLVSMNLTGGGVTLRLNPSQASLGQIEELVNNNVGLLDLDPFAPGDATSFFDVFFEIELPGGQVVHNGTALRVQSVIKEKPPLARYIHLIPPTGPIELLDANNNLTGVFLVQAEHYTGHIERDVFEQTTALIQLAGVPGSSAVTSLILHGPAAADVYFESAEGQARDDDGDGRDEVQTELVSMNLTDGNVTLRLNPSQVSAGQIEERANNTPGILDVAPFTATGMADSFFDVFFELDVPDGSGGTITVHNDRPLHVQAVIDHKPPIARYIHILPTNGPIELVDAAGNPTGVFLVRAEHYTGHIEIDRFPYSLAEVTLIDPQQNTHLVQLSGPSTAHVFFEGSEGQADDDDDDGRDEVATELVQLDLSGQSPLGPVSVRLNPRLPSTGQIEETVNTIEGELDLPPFAAAGTADSFFDVFFEIQVGNRVLYPAKAKRMSSVIDHKPPGEGTVYENSEVIPLLDASGRATGYAIGLTRQMPVGLDFGDAPSSESGLSYPTYLSQNGARHVASDEVYLGRTVDAELDGQPNADATGDDVSGYVDDEDGVTWLTPIVPGETARLEVVASAAGLLNAWLDWNRDGDWLGANDQVFADVPLAPGVNQLSISVPLTATVTSRLNPTFARFRFSTESGLSFDGLAADGEVEDYAVRIQACTTVTSTADSGLGTLRHAITCANSTPGVQTIDFDIPGVGPHTIQPQTALPTITDPVVIDATTQAGYAGAPVIELDGTSAGSLVNGLWIAAGGSTVRGLAINRFGGSGIQLTSAGGNTIQANFLGTNTAGTADRGNLNYGLRIAGSHGNTIGGTTEADRNLIAGNDLSGILITGANLNTIVGNYVGSDVTGSLDRGNTQFGIVISGASSGTTIGGTASGAGNVISGNRSAAIALSGAGVTNTLIQGNRIGTNAAGTSELPNVTHGVQITDGSFGNTIGGTAAGAGNVISGNLAGIFIKGGGTNQVLGNRIGTDATGTLDLGNRGNGIQIDSSSTNNTVGGTLSGAGNVISGNNSVGVAINGSGTQNNVVLGNWIGTSASGSGDLGNTSFGVLISGAVNNTIGGASSGAGNVISGNDNIGVVISGTSAVGNRLEGNRIGTNAAGDADLGNSSHGVQISAGAHGNTIGGTAPGAGNLISGNDRLGVLMTGTGTAGNLVQGNRIGTRLDGNAALGNNLHGVQISSSATGNVIGGTTAGARNQISGNVQSGVFISGAVNNQVQGNLIGTNAAGAAGLGNGLNGVQISSSLATGNTIGGSVAGAGNVISSNIGVGVVINDSASGNVISGNLIGTDVTGGVDLGNGTFGVLLSMAFSNTIGGVAAGAGNVISGNNASGIAIQAGSGNTVQGNRIGTDAGGTLALANSLYGVVLLSNTNGNMIGGMAAGAGNTIAFNGTGGVRVQNESLNNAIRGNAIFDNTGLGIDLVGTGGVTPNDPGDPDTGPNRLQNFPVISSAVLSGGNLTITYVVDSATANSTYPLSIDVYRADSAGQEGASYLATDTYLAAVAQTSRTVTLTVSGLTAGQKIVATATDALGSTSEFSANVVVAAGLLAPAGGGGRSNVEPLNSAQLQPLVSQAVDRWQSAGLDAGRVASLNSLSISVADLPGQYLGLAAPGSLALDADAAGYGWYLGQDEGRRAKDKMSDLSRAAGEVNSGSRLSSLDPRQSMDLLTAVLHEMGHSIGLADLDGDDGLMAGVLQPGTRHLPSLADIDEVLAGDDWLR